MTAHGGPSDILWLGVVFALMMEGAAWGITRLREEYRKHQERKKFEETTRGM